MPCNCAGTWLLEGTHRNVSKKTWEVTAVTIFLTLSIRSLLHWLVKVGADFLELYKFINIWLFIYFRAHRGADSFVGYTVGSLSFYRHEAVG